MENYSVFYTDRSCNEQALKLEFAGNMRCIIEDLDRCPNQYKYKSDDPDTMYKGANVGIAGNDDTFGVEFQLHGKHFSAYQKDMKLW